MGELYRLGCGHREAHAERAKVYNNLTDSLGRYDGPMYCSPAGYAVFKHEEYEAAFQCAYLAEYGIEHTDPCTAEQAAQGRGGFGAVHAHGA